MSGSRCSGPAPMQPVLRRRLPACVSRLLTDIVPKEDPTEPEDEPQLGIVLPRKGGRAEQDLGPGRRASCGLCHREPSCYTCPRCNLSYCSLGCYRSPEHSACSEDFYRGQVLQELRLRGTSETQCRQKMQDVLLALRKRAERTDGGMEGLLRDAGLMEEDDGDDDRGAKESVEVVELLARLAELQQSGEGATTEIQDILRKLGEKGRGGGGCVDDGDKSDEAEYGEEEAELAEQLAGLDIEKLSEVELWDLLPSREKDKFMSLLKGGALGSLVPVWTPWWEEHEEEEEREKLVEEVRTTEDQDPGHTLQDCARTSVEGNLDEGKAAEKVEETDKSSLSRVPDICADIPWLSSLCATPSPLLCYALVNVLFAYCFTVRLFNGDAFSTVVDFCRTLLSVSQALGSTRSFSSLQEALESGEAALLSAGFRDPLSATVALQDVGHVTMGRSRRDPGGLCLAALSEIRSALSQARAELKKEKGRVEERKKFFLANKKCEFLQAWVRESGSRISGLVVEVWDEHRYRERERKSMDGAKSLVEQSWKTGRRSKEGQLIEELS